MPISALPPSPSRGEDPSEFNDKADAIWAAMPIFVTEANALQADVNAKQATASSAATTATTKAAEAAASAATATAAAPAYDSGSTYDWPQIVAFITDGQTYRALVPVAAGQTPITHPAKWMKLSHSGTPDDTTVTPEKLSAGGPDWDAGGNLELIGSPTATMLLKFKSTSGLRYSRTADEFVFVVNGQDVLTLDASGNLMLHGGMKVPSHFTTGQALPTSNIGVIWHDDYNSWMTWQAFTANGAAYTGYASVDIGRLVLDNQPTARTGYFKTGTMSLSKTGFYRQVWNWALHNGMTVALGSWTAGAPVFADNGDGTFRAPDLRAETLRLFDDGRGVDVSRVFKAWQAGQFPSHRHDTIITTGQPGENYGGNVFSGVSNGAGPVVMIGGYTGGTDNSAENRSRNFVQLGTFKA